MYVNIKLKIIWKGKGISEKGYILKDNGEKELIIKIDKKYYRPLEIDYLKGNPKAFKKLKSKIKNNLKDLIKDMIESDIKLANKVNQMEKSDRFYIAGHNGLVGSSVHKILIEKGYKNLITVSSKKLDLRNYSKLKNILKK